MSHPELGNTPTSDLSNIDRAAHDRALVMLHAHVTEVVKKPLDDIDKNLTSFHAKVRWMTVALIFLAMTVAVMAAGVFGYLVNFWNGEAMFYGATAMGTALLGFIAGWIAHRPSQRRG